MALADWAGTPPRPFDIATAFYPEAQPKAAAQSHPCLIIKSQRGRRTGQYRCLVIYGSSNLRSGKYEEPNDLVISDKSTIKSVGLFKPTRFYFSERSEVFLPWNETGFDCWDGFTTPLIGRLTPELVKVAGYCLMHRSRVAGS